MRENKYDDAKFFDQYSQMPRSVQGLQAAGEWHELQKLLPNCAGKRVLDLGCGFGWHCQYVAEHGASLVVGTDISKKMLQIAKSKTAATTVQYLQVAMEDFSYPKESFDLVLSSLALHYVQDFRDICTKVYNCLSSEGEFIFSVEHPIFTAQGPQDWYYDSAGTALHWPVDNYFTQGQRTTTFLGEQVTKYHRTLTTYLSELLQAGFIITQLIEPQPSAELQAQMPQELRRPMMLLLAAKKPKAQ